MCVRMSVIYLLATTVMCVLMNSVHGASISQSVSQSVSTSVSVSTSSSESKSDSKSAIEKASARSLNSAESYEGKVEISAPYARKRINNFSNDDKGRSLKEQKENSTKTEAPITTEKPEIEPEITTTELIEPIVTSEKIVKKIELQLNSQIVKEPSETTTENDVPATTVVNETTSKKDDAITTTKPETESSSIQSSSTESSSTESISTESSTSESSPKESDTTESNSNEPSATTETAATDSTESIIETTQINLTSDSERSLASRSLDLNKTNSDQIVFEDQTEASTVPVPEIGLRAGTETDKVCDVKVNGECRQAFEQ